jgi:hypothetical protein
VLGGQDSVGGTGLDGQSSLPDKSGVSRHLGADLGDWNITHVTKETFLVRLDNVKT